MRIENGLSTSQPTTPLLREFVPQSSVSYSPQLGRIASSGGTLLDRTGQNVITTPSLHSRYPLGVTEALAAVLLGLSSLRDNFEIASTATQERVLADRSQGRGVIEGARAYSSEVLSGLKIAQSSGILGGGTSGMLSAASGWTGTISAVGNFISLFQAGDNVKPSDAALSGAVNGAYIGTQILPGWGTAIGAVVGGIAGFASSFFGGGKHKDQVARDQIRDLLKRSGVIDDKYCLTLANGQKFDIGKDGGARLTNTDGNERHMYDVDFTHPLAAETVGLANPLAYLITGGDKKLASDFCGYFTNAALSNATNAAEARQNMLSILSSLKASPQQLMSGLELLLSSGKISQSEHAAFANGLRALLS